MTGAGLAIVLASCVAGTVGECGDTVSSGVDGWTVLIALLVTAGLVVAIAAAIVRHRRRD